MPTLILSPRYSDDSNLLWKTAGQSNWHLCRLQSWEMPIDLEVRDPVFYGEPIFCDLVAGWLGYQLDTPSEFCLGKMPYELIKRQVRYTTYFEAQKLTQPKFIKPPIHKRFAARVYQNPSLELNHPADPQEPVLISDPVEFGIEIRSFILDRKIVTFSPYVGHWAARSNRWDLMPEEAPGFENFVKKVVTSVGTSAAYVLDVGFIKNKGWAVIEVSPVSSSSIYGCDPKKVLEVLRRAKKNI